MSSSGKLKKNQHDLKSGCPRSGKVRESQGKYWFLVLVREKSGNRKNCGKVREKSGNLKNVGQGKSGKYYLCLVKVSNNYVLLNKFCKGID